MLPIVADDAKVNSTQVEQCAIGSGATISEKTSLKRCVIGANCFVQPKVRISDSILMNGVMVEEA